VCDVAFLLRNTVRAAGPHLRPTGRAGTGRVLGQTGLVRRALGLLGDIPAGEATQGMLQGMNSGTRFNYTANEDHNTVVSRLQSDENVTHNAIESAVVFFTNGCLIHNGTHLTLSLTLTIMLTLPTNPNGNSKRQP